ncbi:MAG: glycosyltransferase family 9 protein [Fibrobacter sp.]|nr:glycosyltransferase family 9 protein [Fibrobacter sp.]
MTSTVKKILVIRFSAMGDVILTAPLFPVLKEHFADCEITFLTDTKYVMLFSEDKYLSSVKGISKVEEISATDLSRQNWDLVIDLQNNRKSHSVIDVLPNRRQTCKFSKLHLKRVMLLLTRINLYKPDDHVINRYIGAVGELSQARFSSPVLFFDKNLPQRIEDMIQCGKIKRPNIAFFPFTAWKNKEWIENYFITVGRYFMMSGWNVIIMGGPSDRERAENMRKLVGKRCFSLAGKISLYECGQVLSNCALALGNDTGLSHLARSCGVKTGVIYGPATHHLGFYPVKDPPFVVFEKNLFCRPCHAHGGNRCLRLRRQCMRRIKPDEVISGLLHLFYLDDSGSGENQT